MKKNILPFLFIGFKLFAQDNILVKSCDTSYQKEYTVCDFENYDFKAGLIKNGAFFISSFKELNSFLHTNKRGTSIVNSGGKIIAVDFQNYNVLLFSTLTSGSGGNPQQHAFKAHHKKNMYIFHLHIYSGHIVMDAAVPLYHFYLIPKNIPKENIRFEICP